MNRRGFLKCIALTPLVGLLKPERVFKGEITNVEVFDKVLTDREISRLCNTTGEVYGKSPIQSALEDMRRLNTISQVYDVESMTSYTIQGKDVVRVVRYTEQPFHFRGETPKYVINTIQTRA